LSIIVSCARLSGSAAFSKLFSLALAFYAGLGTYTAAAAPDCGRRACHCTCIDSRCGCKGRRATEDRHLDEFGHRGREVGRRSLDDDDKFTPSLITPRARMMTQA